MMRKSKVLKTYESIDNVSRILFTKINDLARLSGMKLKDFIQNFVSQTTEPRYQKTCFMPM